MNNPMELPPEKREELRKKPWTGEPKRVARRTEWQEDKSNKSPTRVVGSGFDWDRIAQQFFDRGVLSNN